MISFQKVTKEYHLDEETIITPLNNTTFDIFKGDFLIIVGRSGAGKTTLLNLAAGLIRPTYGRVLIDDLDMADMTDKQLSLLRSQRMGFIFQFPSLLPSLTVLENVSLPVKFAPHNRRQDPYNRAQNLLQMVGLSQRQLAYPRQLSAGEQKRAVIARAMINQPEILLADEPTADLDELTEKEIIARLKEIHDSGVTIVMVTHNLQLLPYANKALVIENGSLRMIQEDLTV